MQLRGLVITATIIYLADIHFSNWHYYSFFFVHQYF